MTDRLHFVQGPAIEGLDAERGVMSSGLPPIGDYYRWGLEQAALIRAGRFDRIDVLNIADEIEDVAKRERRAVASNVEVVLLHMLKWEFQPAKRSISWLHSIEGHRERIEDGLQDSPSLRTETSPIIERAYRHARRGAARETRLSIKTFPPECPFSWAEIMQAPYELAKD